MPTDCRRLTVDVHDDGTTLAGSVTWYDALGDVVAIVVVPAGALSQDDPLGDLLQQTPYQAQLPFDVEQNGLSAPSAHEPWR